MKRNIATGIFLIGALALSSCSTTKLAHPETSDDVYFSNARAGSEPTYAAADNYNPNAASNQQQYLDDDDSDDYFYYDDYASRINRFSYFSPFSYYDNLYYGYSDPFYNSGFSLGFNYGPWGYGYSPYGYGLGGWGLGYGYGGWGSGLGYGYGWGGWGYGYPGWGLGYGGFYGGGYYTGGTPRPYRGQGFPFSRPAAGGGSNTPSRPGFGNRVPAGSNGIGYIPGGRNNYNMRPARTDARPARSDNQPARAAEARPVMQQPTYDRTSSPSNNNSGGGSRSSSGGSGGGGGGRPSRP